MNYGKVGEAAFTEYLRNNRYSYEDVSGNPEYWHRDIDFTLESQVEEGKEITVEVKSDSLISKTGNFFIEFENSHPNGGWYNFCEADYIAYYDVNNKLFYIIDNEKLHDYIDANEFRIQRRWCRCANEWSQGYIIPTATTSFVVAHINMEER